MPISTIHAGVLLAEAVSVFWQPLSSSERLSSRGIAIRLIGFLLFIVRPVRSPAGTGISPDFHCAGAGCRSRPSPALHPGGSGRRLSLIHIFDTGKAAAVLEQLIAVSNGPEVEA